MASSSSPSSVITLSATGAESSSESEEDDQKPFCAQMGELFTEAKFWDHTIKCGEDDYTYHVHKAILAKRSGFFNTLFSHPEVKEVREDISTFPKIDPEHMGEALRFMYQNTTMCDLNGNMGLELLKIASVYLDIPSLAKRCQKSLSKGLTVDNVCERFIFADFYTATRLKAMALKFMFDRNNRIAVYESDGWNKIEGPLLLEAYDFISFGWKEKINIQLQYGGFTFLVRGEWTVKNLKMKLEKEKKIAFVDEKGKAKKHINFSGMQLSDDSRTLDYYGIDRGSTIHVVDVYCDEQQNRKRRHNMYVGFDINDYI